MIRFYLKEQMAELGFKEKRRVTIDEVSRATGIGRNTLSKIANSPGCNTTTDNLNLLCKYFGCVLDDIAKYIDEV